MRGENGLDDRIAFILMWTCSAVCRHRDIRGHMYFILHVAKYNQHRKSCSCRLTSGGVRISVSSPQYDGSVSSTWKHVPALCFCLSRSDECNSAICCFRLNHLIHKLIKHVYFCSCGVVGFNICKETCTAIVNELG